jgi:hypothetical protein
MLPLVVVTESFLGGWLKGSGVSAGVLHVKFQSVGP